jgi:hypothetical protein
MLRSVEERELMMAPIKSLLGSRCGAGIAGRKFSEADVGCDGSIRAARRDGGQRGDTT